MTSSAARVAAALAVAATSLSGCAARSAGVGDGSGQSAATVTAGCQPVAPPQYPTTDGTIPQSGAGSAWCVGVGETVVVQLTVPVQQGAAPWSMVASSNPDVLQPVSNGVVTLPRGVTATFFAARAPGVVRLTSTRPDGATWAATAVVQPS